MKAIVISFTACGCSLGTRIGAALRKLGWATDVFVKSKYADSAQAIQVRKPLEHWMQEHWKNSDAVIFVGAAGIAVRTIAPFVQSKKTDPAVLCVDEKGRYCISLLSGHLGGANALAEELADYMGAVAVISTATDLNDCFAVDLFAKKQGYELLDMELAKEISAGLLGGKKMVTVGIGCRKGTAAAEIMEAVFEVCAKNRISLKNIKQFASIDLKKEEPGILQAAKTLDIPFLTYPAEALNRLPGAYTTSLFVQSVTGADNVCERSAVLGSGCGILIQKKYTAGHVTVALAIETEEKT